MKKLLLTLLLSSFSFATTNVVVSILPLKIFVDKIGGERVDTTVMVEAGSSPHNYEPKPSQMKKITQAKLYISIGVEFEKVWLSKFINQNKQLIIADASQDINKSNMTTHHHNENQDPHIWVDPINVKSIAQNIFYSLSKIDKKNTTFYQKNLTNYLKELDELDNKIKEILKETPENATFMVFHPAWGYFAKRYHLQQLAVEIEGKEPKMRALVQLIKKAKKEKVKAIFTQPEFSDKSAKVIANDLHINVIKTSPLAENWSENLVNLAKAISNKK